MLADQCSKMFAVQCLQRLIHNNNIGSTMRMLAAQCRKMFAVQCLWCLMHNVCSTCSTVFTAQCLMHNFFRACLQPDKDRNSCICQHFDAHCDAHHDAYRCDAYHYAHRGHDYLKAWSDYHIYSEHFTRMIRIYCWNAATTKLRWKMQCWTLEIVKYIRLTKISGN